MTIYFTIVILGLVVAVVILYPLWQLSADMPIGDGRKCADNSAMWVDEKNRITAQLSELDFALVQGKIDQEKFEAEKVRLAAEGERILQALGKARTSSNGDDTANYVARTYPKIGLMSGVGFIIATTTLSVFLGTQIVRRDVSPHSAGTIPLPADTNTVAKTSIEKRPNKSTAQNAPVIGADGKPNVSAMVARLEKKVEKADAPLKDIMMLAQSYKVLGREQKALTLYRRAVKKAPNNEGVLMIAGQNLIRSKNDAISKEAEGLIDKVLQSNPNLPEAMWLKSLGLLRRHKIAEATALLHRLQGFVTSNPRAKKAVNELLAQLKRSAEAPPPQKN